MSLGFVFDATINPEKPLDPDDPPPRGWNTDIDTHDHRTALFGHPSQLFTDCAEWAKREKERVSKQQHPNASRWAK